MLRPRSERLRTRTLTGCYTCRERKLKCDDRRPECQRCSTLGVVCKGYAPKLSWVDSTLDIIPTTSRRTKGSGKGSKGRPSPDPTTRRRPLFTNRERADMVHETQKAFLHGNQDRNIERAIENLHTLSEEDISYLPQAGEEIGPFGVFLLQPESSEPAHNEFFHTSGSPPVSEVPSSTHAQSAPTPGDIPGGPHGIDNYGLAWVENVGEITLPWLDTTENGLWPMSTSSLLPPDPSSASDETVTRDWGLFAPSYLDVTPSATPGQQPWPGQNNLDEIPRSLSNIRNIMKIPPESRFLLEHYFTEVVDYMCHLPNPQSPWRTIHFPCAMSTMADLLVFGAANHARMALFYALLSVSANHLNSKLSWSPAPSLSQNETAYIECAEPVPSNYNYNYWLVKGSFFQRQAAAQLHACLQAQPRDCATDPEVYKELLMGLLSMVTISVTSGKLKSADTYLRHAKRVIDVHVRATSSQATAPDYRSHKVAALHQIYSYLHVIYNSTKVAQPLQDSDGILGPMAPPSPPPSLEGPPQDETDSQFFARTYGVPHSLLKLISRASAAAREIDAHKGNGTDWQRLEDKICSWRPPHNDELPRETDSQQQPTYNPQIRSHLVQAMHDALVVMFFRRVRPINRIVLQHYVESAAEHLNEQEKAKVQAGISAPALLWPWFMVAVEAVGESVRQKLSMWAMVAKRYGGRNLEVAEQVVTEVWRRQDQQLVNSSWVDVVREWDVTLVLT